MNYIAKMNMPWEARINRHDRFKPQYGTFPNTHNPCSPNDFISDDMSGFQSINYLEFDEIKNSLGCTDFKSTRRGRWSHYRGRWSGQEGPNGGYYSRPEHGGYPSNHHYHKFSDQHSKGGRRANLKKPNSQESASKQEPVILVESGEPRPAEAVQETSPSEKELDATLSDFQSKKKNKKKLKRIRQKERKAAIEAQAGGVKQLKLTTDPSQDVDGATAEKQQLAPELEKRKRKKKQSAEEEPKLKMVKISGASKDLPNKPEAKKAGTLKTDSNPEATGQSSVLPLKEELALLKIKEKFIPLSGHARHSEKTNKDLTFSPVGLNTVKQNSCGAVSSAQALKSTADGGSCTQKRLKAKTDQELSNRGKKLIYRKRISAHRLTFVCQVCKFSSFYKWKLKAHLKSKFHRDHFKYLSEHLSKPTVDSLKAHLSMKQQKVQDFINQLPDHCATLCQVYEDQDLTLDISMEHFIKKAEVAHCLACDEYIPMQYYLIQLHIQSPDHKANCKDMMFHSKNFGLSTVQRFLRLKCTRQKLECYLKDTGVIKEPKRNTKEVWSTQQRVVLKANMMTQESVLPFEKAMQANKAEEDGKDKKTCSFNRQVIQSVEAEKDGIDLKAKLICGEEIQATAAVGNGKTQLQKPVCVLKTQADGAGEKKNEVGTCIKQGNDVLGEEKKIVDPFCGLMIEAFKEVGDGKDQEVKPTCGQVIPADDIVRKRKEREEKPVCRKTMQVDEAQVKDPLSKKVAIAPDPVINGESQACEESIPATEHLQQHLHTQPIFDLLDEEDDLEGVELGEEEMGEDI